MRSVLTRSIVGGGPPGDVCAKTGETQKIMRGSAINKGLPASCLTLIADLPVFVIGSITPPSFEDQSSFSHAKAQSRKALLRFWSFLCVFAPLRETFLISNHKSS